MSTGQTWYVVVTRQGSLPISRHMLISEAGDRIVRDRAFAKWRVLAQHGNTASAPMRELTHDERVKLEQALYPGLFNLGREHKGSD